MDRQRKFLDEMISDKPESFQEEVFEPVHKWPRRLILVAIILVISIAVFFFLPHMSDVTVPDMTKWQYEEIDSWARKYHDNTIIKGIYHNKVEKSSVISQDIASGKRIKKDQSLTVTYSLGADPEEMIKIPDIMDMTMADIKQWISDHQLTGVTIKQEESEIIPENKVISFDLIDGTADEFQRKSRMVIYISSGTGNLNESFQMPDLYGKTKTEVLQWAKSQQVEITLLEMFNQDVDYGKVCDQNIKKDTKITRKDRIEVSISRGKSILVPDFTGMNKSEAQELAKLLGISVFFQFVNSSEKIDTVLSQDVVAKTEIDQKQVVTISIAKEDGKIVVPDFRGLSTEEVNNLASLYGMKVFIHSMGDVGEGGTVVSQTVTPGTKIAEDQIVTLDLTDNKELVSIPDFTGLKKSKAIEMAKNIGIELLFDEQETMEVKNQTVISQDRMAKEKMKQGDTLLLTIAINSGIQAINVFDMKLKDVKAWAIQNGISLNIVECYSNDFASGTLFYQDCNEGDWILTGKTFTVYHSLGKVFVPDFIGKTKTDVIDWRDEVNRKGADITITFLDENNTGKKKGSITSQSITEEETGLSTTITLWISSSDDGVVIPNFEGMDIEDFKLWCDTNSIPYIINECYSDSYPKGSLYGQNYMDTYLPKNTYLRINYSLGKVYIEDFVSKTKAELVAWQKEVNKKMANIQIEYYYEYSFLVEKGCIIRQSIKDTELDLNSKIVVVISSDK
ncbi:MAG: serine/threonine kinase [Herbinix sp.]|jgi:serine/threonine-protein kinase|nr:serine/threonine kinase [Herbinix sp.]